MQQCSSFLEQYCQKKKLIELETQILRITDSAKKVQTKRFTVA